MIIITLKNFKCFLNAKFIFKDFNNILISAPSGYGKTTIFEAIRFVLWGNKDSDIITFNKNTCEVVFEFNDLIFTRKKRPNYFKIVHAQLGNIECPEEYINKHFPQYFQGFLEFTGNKQLEIFESISCENNNVQNTLEKISGLITESNRKISDIKSKIQIYTHTLESLPNILQCKKPIKPEKSFKKSYDSLTRLRRKQELFFENKTRRRDLGKELGVIKESLSTDFKNYKTSEDPKNIYLEIATITQLENQLAELNKISCSPELISSVDSIQAELFSLLNKQNLNAELESQIKILKKNSPVKNPVSENTVETPTHICPECKTHLILRDSVLIKTTPPIVVKILELQNKKEHVDLKRLEFLKNQLETISMCKNNKIKITEITDKLKNSKSLKELEESCAKITKFNDLIKRKECILNTFKTMDEMQIKDCSELIAKTEEELVNISEYDHELKLWNQYQDIINLKKEYTQKITSAETTLKHLLKFLTHLENLKKITKESQTKSLSSLLFNFNNIIKKYLINFFKEDISVCIKKSKQVKTTKIFKPQIFIEIFYKGNYTKLQNLSSGEYARVGLAIDLALYEITGNKSPLLLDEVTSNLDSETSTKILNFIKREFKEKYIFFIAHQVVQGIFDQVITEHDISDMSTKIC